MNAVDLFAGGGGASLGIQRATGRSPIYAVNHSAAAIAMHAANHPETRHDTQDIAAVSPRAAVGRRRIHLLWASPSCVHFSRARGSEPLDAGIRGHAWHVLDWARTLRPGLVCLENVPEFQSWGPVRDGQPIRERAGEDFDAFVAGLRLLGYRVSWRVLCAADYGAPTIRRRLFLIARRDAEPVWPEPSHGPGRLPWRTAAECIDWSIPCPSIFGRARPLAEATMRRIAAGLRKYVLNSPRPFVVRTAHQSSDAGKVASVDAPLSTVVTKAEHLLVAPTLARVGNGERTGQAPRCEPIEAPLSTVVGSGKHALVTAFLSKHFTGAVGSDLADPLGTVTAVDHHSLAAVHLTKFYGTSTGAPVTEPAPTTTASGQHAGLVYAFLTKYYKQGSQAQGCDMPLDTIVSKDRFGLVQVRIDGEPYIITDIGMRMLQPRELARAQGFPDTYILTGTKAEQVARIGNSVCPAVAEAIVRANLETT